MDKSLNVEIWSDIACPWCYVGKRRFEAALARFPNASGVHVTWRSFELDPAATSVPSARDYAARLARKYGTSLVAAQAMIERMTETAAGEGLAMDFTRVRGGNTFDGHRLLHLAQTRGVQDALKERLLRGYFCEGADMADAAGLVRMASEAGIDADEAQGVLASDLYRDAVRADQARARALGIDGVPFFLLGQRFGIAGAQAATHMREALDKAWNEVAEPAQTRADGAACGPEGCA